MNYRMIVLDLDDTLLKDDRTVSEMTRRRLLEAQQQGTVVVLASGRPTYAMQHLAQELYLAQYGGYLISFNGARITACENGAVLSSVDISHAQMCQLFDLAQEQNVYIQTYTEDHILVSKDNEYTQIEKEITGMDVVECADFKAEILHDTAPAARLNVVLCEIAEGNFRQAMLLAEKELENEPYGLFNTVTDGGIKSIYDYVKEFCQKKQ